MSDSQKRLDNEPPHVPCDLLKASFDKIPALGALIVLLPIYLLIIVLIKVEGLQSSGAGRSLPSNEDQRGPRISLYKFRTQKQRPERRACADTAATDLRHWAETILHGRRALS